MTGSARTVLGDVPADQLGLTLGHEHLITHPASHLLDGDDLILDDEDKAITELERFHAAGGGALVELTTREYGRDAGRLRRLAAASPVHIIATTGHVSADYWRDVVDVDAMDEADLVNEMVQELTAGIGLSGVRAGIVKAGSSKDEVTAAEERVLRAAARAQAATGAPITTHTTAGTMAAEQARILLDAGADPTHTCIGHLDRRLDFDEHRRLAEQGFFLGYDCTSKDWYEPDSRRVEFIIRLFDLGLGGHICLSGDLARRSSLVAWGGGPGYTHIPHRLIPWLRKAGLGDREVSTLTVRNPARLLAWR
jgi:5-phospho-D-xylono-1,4-lactonase